MYTNVDRLQTAKHGAIMINSYDRDVVLHYGGLRREDTYRGLLGPRHRTASPHPWTRPGRACPASQDALGVADTVSRGRGTCRTSRGWPGVPDSEGSDKGETLDMETPVRLGRLGVAVVILMASLSALVIAGAAADVQASD